MVAAVNLARQGRVRFARSRPPILLEAQGGAVEAVKGNPTPTVIPRVDAPKRVNRTGKLEIDRHNHTWKHNYVPGEEAQVPDQDP